MSRSSRSICPRRACLLFAAFVLATSCNSGSADDVVMVDVTVDTSGASDAPATRTDVDAPPTGTEVPAFIPPIVAADLCDSTEVVSHCAMLAAADVLVVGTIDTVQPVLNPLLDRNDGFAGIAECDGLLLPALDVTLSPTHMLGEFSDDSLVFRIGSAQLHWWSQPPSLDETGQLSWAGRAPLEPGTTLGVLLRYEEVYARWTPSWIPLFGQREGGVGAQTIETCAFAEDSTVYLTFDELLAALERCDSDDANPRYSESIDESIASPDGLFGASCD